MKYLYFLVDGAADSPQQSLENRTPLEAAKTPTFDMMCASGELGLARCIRDAVPAGTESALIELFGGEPKPCGRAYLEAPGFGLTIDPDEQAMRANFIAVEDYAIVSHCAGEVSQSESHELLEALRKEETVASMMRELNMQLLEGETFRNVWAIKTDEPLPDLNPPHEHIGGKVYDLMPQQWAKIMMKMADVLSDHPINQQRRADGKMEANMVWPWGAGERVELPSLFERTGLSGGCVAGAAVAKGAARLAGMTAIDLPGATADIHTDWKAKAQACLELFKEHDAVFLHLEAPDECAHAGEALEKVEGIEMADSITSIILKGLQECGEDCRAMIFPDHYTFSDTRKHGPAPTPYLLYDSRAKAVDSAGNSKKRFTEADCADKPEILGRELWIKLAEKH